MSDGIEDLKKFFATDFERHELYQLYVDPEHPTEEGALRIIYDLLALSGALPPEWGSPLGSMKVSNEQVVKDPNLAATLLKRFVEYIQLPGNKHDLLSKAKGLDKGSY